MSNSKRTEFLRAEIRRVKTKIANVNRSCSTDEKSLAYEQKLRNELTALEQKLNFSIMCERGKR